MVPPSVVAQRPSFSSASSSSDDDEGEDMDVAEADDDSAVAMDEVDAMVDTGDNVAVAENVVDNMIIEPNEFFANSSAPKNFLNVMRAVSGKRQRKRRRYNDDDDNDYGACTPLSPFCGFLPS